MKNLYIARCSELISNQNDVKIWNSIYKMLPPSISLIDRTGYIRMPFKFRTYEPFHMIRDISNFNKTYKECCQIEAEKIFSLSKKIDKPITILYSGGIDSTTVVVSFLETLGLNEFRTRVQLAMTVESITENPRFYYDHLRHYSNIISSENIGNLLDGESLVVTGEFNDQLFGSDIVGEIYRYGDSTQLHNKIDSEYITGWMNKFMTKHESYVWFDLIYEQIRNAAPCEVSTNYHFFWWYNFCLKWQSVYFRMLVRLDSKLRPRITKEFLDTYLHHFFSSSNFQKWSMLNHSKKIDNTWPSYKNAAKEVIYNFNKDSEYRDQKLKDGSLYRLFLQKKTIEAITDDWQFLDSIDPSEYYLSDNSFANY